jgi:hypothetical protein
LHANALAVEQIALAQHRLTVSLFEILTEEQQEQALALIAEMPDDEFPPRHRGRRGGPPSGE